MHPVFDAGAQLRKVRFMMGFALLCGLAAVFAGVHAARTYGLAEGDGGVLKPLPVRLAWGVGIGALGVAFASAMGLYGRCYVARIEWDEVTGEYHVHTVRWLGTRRHVRGRDAFGRTRLHDGKPGWARLLVGRRLMTVDAPWWTLPIQGRRIPLIVDVQGDVYDDERFYELVALADEGESGEPDDELDDEFEETR